MIQQPKYRSLYLFYIISSLPFIYSFISIKDAQIRILQDIGYSNIIALINNNTGDEQHDISVICGVVGLLAHLALKRMYMRSLSVLQYD